MIWNFQQFLKESVIVRDRNQEIFNYSGMINQAWHSIIKEAQDFFNIHFDLENDESTGTKKTIYVPKMLRKDQPIKYEFNCESFEAGGDWEMPVLYFRVEFTYGLPGYSKHKDKPEYVCDLERDISKDQYLSNMHDKYVFIPDVDNGNYLIKDKDGYRAYTDEDLAKEDLKWKDVEPDEKKAWRWLEKLLNKIVRERHEMLDEPDRANLTDSAPQKLDTLPPPEPQIQIVQNSPHSVPQPVQNIQVDPVQPILPDGKSQLISQ